MKTPMQEAIEKVQSLRQIDAVINPIGVIESILSKMLEKEKEVMCNFTADYTTLWEFQPLCGQVISIQDYYNETFKTKENE